MVPFSTNVISTSGSAGGIDHLRGFRNKDVPRCSANDYRNDEGQHDALTPFSRLKMFSFVFDSSCWVSACHANHEFRVGAQIIAPAGKARPGRETMLSRFAFFPLSTGSA